MSFSNEDYKGFRGTPFSLYCPSNGTEGMMFMEDHCDVCVHQPDDPNEGCDILCKTLFLSTKDEDYPREWQYNEHGIPTCTKFEKDWSKS